MRRRRIHWFWRATIAVFVAIAVDLAIRFVLAHLLSPPQFGNTLLILTLAVVQTSIPLVAYGLLTVWFGPSASDPGETRCRACDYILRGITEPRCPECGERI